MKYTGKRQAFSAEYLRFHKQLSALHASKLWLVKTLAMEAKEDIRRKNTLQQISLSILL